MFSGIPNISAVSGAAAKEAYKRGLFDGNKLTDEPLFVALDCPQRGKIPEMVDVNCGGELVSNFRKSLMKGLRINLTHMSDELRKWYEKEYESTIKDEVGDKSMKDSKGDKRPKKDKVMRLREIELVENAALHCETLIFSEEACKFLGAP
mgnify:CR=1 FL=1